MLLTICFMGKKAPKITNLYHMNCQLMQRSPSSLSRQLVSIVSCASLHQDEAKPVSLKVSIEFASCFPTQCSTVSLFFTSCDAVFLKKTSRLRIHNFCHSAVCAVMLM